MNKLKSYKLRIIAGKFKGTIINVPQTATLRPTSERMRETLFNWLQGNIHGNRCLDLFAGSGLLSMEAFSRGAEHVTLVEKDLTLYKYLKNLQNKLQLNCNCLHGDALKILPTLPTTYDLIFLDPPYESTLLVDSLRILMKKFNNQQYLVYYETSQDIDFTSLGYKIYRSSKAGYKKFGLLIANNI